MGTLRRLRWVAPLALVLAGSTLACTAESGDETAEQGAAATGTKAYDPALDLDESLGEKLWPNEQADIKATSEIIQTFIKRRQAEGRTDPRGRVRFLRDAHAKMHGCVKGDFTVRDAIPGDLKVGVFAKPHTFKSWLRYSNGNSEVRSDWKVDARGMAIKLTNVPGEKLVPELPEQSTQDFVMINHPVFFVDNPVKYAETLKIFHSGLGFEAIGQILSIGKLCDNGLPTCETAKLALAVNGSHIKNPVRDPYWSMAAFRLGHQAVKLAAIPVACGNAKAFPSTLQQQQEFIAEAQKNNKSFLPSTHRDELREAMQETLERDREDACFTFVLQRFVDQDRTPTERSTVNWDLVSPMIPVADLRIPAQTFTSEAQDTFCDDMAFTPWHTLPEHKPLGVVNRTRFVVYTATAKLRREGNHPPTGTALTGPTGEERF
jgi:Catalase